MTSSAQNSNLGEKLPQYYYRLPTNLVWWRFLEFSQLLSVTKSTRWQRLKRGEIRFPFSSAAFSRCRYSSRGYLRRPFPKQLYSSLSLYFSLFLSLISQTHQTSSIPSSERLVVIIAGRCARAPCPCVATPPSVASSYNVDGKTENGKWSVGRRQHIWLEPRRFSEDARRRHTVFPLAARPCTPDDFPIFRDESDSNRVRKCAWMEVLVGLKEMMP